MKQKLLIIQQHQFGYLTDSYKWCEYLRDEYEITVVCYDAGKEKLNLAGINVKYLPINGTRYTRGIKFILTCLWNILRNDKTIIVYFEKCYILKQVLPFKKMIMDVRTLSVHKNSTFRKSYNTALSKSGKHFDLITAISTGVAQQLNLQNKRIKILPLGADIISKQPKNYESLKLLYIGTLTNRDIHKTIEGFNSFIRNHPEAEISYDIIGDGNGDELQELKGLVSEKKLDKWIHFYGRIPYNNLTSFFDKCNIGISFVPMTEYFEFQPPTKTFEYALSGLFVIATATSSNKELITADNGIIINDSPEDFADALTRIYSHNTNLTEAKIRLSLSEYKWNDIVNNQLKPILKEL